MVGRHPDQSRRRARRSQAGFSIVEMLLVFAIIGIAVLPLATVQFYSRREVTEAGRHTRAVEMAQATIERMRARGFGQAVPDTLQDGPFTAASGVVPISPTLEELRVTVSWQHGESPRSLTLSCLQSMR
jgi:Tfp pilus assembly protein PilV